MPKQSFSRKQTTKLQKKNVVLELVSLKFVLRFDLLLKRCRKRFDCWLQLESIPFWRKTLVGSAKVCFLSAGHLCHMRNISLGSTHLLLGCERLFCSAKNVFAQESKLLPASLQKLNRLQTQPCFLGGLFNMFSNKQGSTGHCPTRPSWRCSEWQFEPHPPARSLQHG